MDRQPTLETERLVLRPLAEADREALHEIASDPAVWEQHPIHDRWRREVFDAFFDEGLASGGARKVQPISTTPPSSASYLSNRVEPITR